MKLSDFMQGRSPDPAYEALVADTTDAMILAIDLENTGKPNDYVVANEGIAEHSGTLNPEAADSQYVHSGKRTSKIGNQRQFSLNGDRFSGDVFQDMLLSHEMKYGVGNAIIKPYLYFNSLTGKGEEGVISIMIEDDLGGAAGENSSFSATLYAQGKPKEYAYAPPTP